MARRAAPLPTAWLKCPTWWFLTIFVMAILGPLKMAGALDATTQAVLRFATTAKKTEFAIFALVTVLYPICASNTPALLFSGPMVRELGARFQIHRCRRANLMDMAGNGISGSLPHINTMLALAGAAMATAEATGAPVVSIGQVGVLAFYPIALTLTALFAIASGWGSRPRLVPVGFDDIRQSRIACFPGIL